MENKMTEKDNYMDFVLLTEKMLEREKYCKGIIEKGYEYIPKDSSYCYDGNHTCPFFDMHPYIEEQSNGYCHLLHLGDWNSKGCTQLFDQVKECYFFDEYKEDYTEEEWEEYLKEEIEIYKGFVKDWNVIEQ